jgi:uncharacterized C2H2 Zn-finger protein
MKTLKNEAREMLTQNLLGNWVPAIPLPYSLIIGCRCPLCDKFFISEERYEKHFLYHHIWKGVRPSKSNNYCKEKRRRS